MKCLPVVAYSHRLDHLFEQVRRNSGVGTDPELLAHWARYLCVLVSGFLETAVREIYGEYADKKSAPHFASFVRDHLQGVRNPNMESILKTTRSFSQDWSALLVDLVDTEHETAVNSIIANRHHIVHGRQSGVTFAQIDKWYKLTKETVELMEQVCGL